MRHITRTALIAVVLAAVPLVADAQVLGTVTGAVKDASGAVLPGVTVEVASPALIEKTRTATTDGTGLYRIVNLPPGTYSVTFTLQGFNTVKREAVDVTAGFIATIDAELRVGTVEETITVTGESPVVDLQSASQTRSVTAQVFKEIPSSGSWVQMAALVPAVRASVQDVGGILGVQTGAEVSAHGSRTGDGVSMIDGLRIGNMYLSSNLTNMSLSPLLFDQVDVQLSGQMAETGTNGVIMNAIPKSGGNKFSGSALANGSGPSLQSSNVTDRLQARGLQSASTTLKTLYDLNGAVGGPIKRDKVWFYVTSRYFKNEYYLASRYFPADPAAILRAPDTSQQAYGGTYTYDNNGRVTWAINDKQKISSWYAYQYKVDPHWLIQVFTISPEAARVTTWHTQLSTTKYTNTLTNRLLLEAGFMAGASPDTIQTDLSRVGGIGIQDQTSGLTYRSPTGYVTNTTFDNDDHLPSQSYNVSLSYVTGAHNAKIGMELQHGYFHRNDTNDSTGGLWYTVNSVIDPATGRATAVTPAFVTIQSAPGVSQNNLNYNVGIFMQDRWTLNRLTLSGGLRLDLQNESTEPFSAGPNQWLPTRNISLPAVKNVPNWKDVNPRVSLAYDLFGTGKTALKASASRGVEQDSIRYASANNPASTLQAFTTRTWNDSLFGGGDPRTSNFKPDCDLLSSVPNGECGPWLQPNFGSRNPATAYDPAIMNGWGVRPYNWEFSTSIQQEVLPRVSATFGYYRRIGGNFQITDNEALTAADFSQYSVTVPNDPRLSNAGQTITGLYDVNVLVPARNVVKDASTFGTQIAHFDGFDLTADARIHNGFFIQGGVSTGRTITDNCNIVAQAPELLTVAGVLTPKEFCHFNSGFVPQYKALASYTLPYGVRISGTFQSVAGPQIAANTIYSNTNPNPAFNRVTATTLARPFTLAQATINLINPGTLYGDRLNQFDLRFTKIVGVGYGRVDLNVDLYNAFNSDAILTQLNTFGPVWGLPLSVIQPRFVKFSARWDF
jgi:hypothetical protein